MKDAKLEASLAMWIMFATYIGLVFILGVANFQLSQRIDAIESLREEMALQRGVDTLQGEQLGRCMEDQRAWHRWLELRAEGHGSAWWLRRKPEEVDR